MFYVHIHKNCLKSNTIYYFERKIKIQKYPIKQTISGYIKLNFLIKTDLLIKSDNARDICAVYI